MRIAIDVSIITPAKAGIGYYTHSIVEALSEIDKENEYTIGIGIIAFILLIFVSIFHLLNKNRSLKKYTLAYSIGLVYLFFIVIGDFSIHKIFFENIPGFNSIRCPSRYVIFVGYFSIFLIFYTFDKIIKNNKDKKAFSVFIVLSLTMQVEIQPFTLCGYDSGISTLIIL